MTADVNILRISNPGKLSSMLLLKPSKKQWILKNI
jgi:hypothetical protein